MTDRQLEYQTAARLASMIGQERLSREEAFRRLKSTGLPLPPSGLIDQELRRWFALFEPDSHARLLRRKREASLQVMKALRAWHPHLIGPVLSGAATESDLPVILLSGNAKELELFFLARNIPYSPANRALNISCITYLTAVGCTDLLIEISEHPRYPRATPPDPYQTPAEALGKIDADSLEALLAEQSVNKD